MKVEVLGTTPNPQQMITWVARFSHRSHDKASPEADAKLFAALYRQRHWAALEFNRWTVRVSTPPNRSLELAGQVADFFAQAKGWEATRELYGDWYISGNARTLIESRQHSELARMIAGELSGVPGWEWVWQIHDDNVPWQESLEKPEFGDVYIYDPDLDLVPAKRAKHAAALFVFRDVSRVFTHQMVRHRLCSFMQESLRHVKPKGLPWVCPKSVRKIERQGLAGARVWDALNFYDDLLKRGVPKEDARFILPLGIKTTLVVMASLCEWAHIIRLRTSKAAQWEIRKKMEWVRDVLLEKVPWFKEVLDETDA